MCQKEELLQLGYFSRLKSDSERWIEKGIIVQDERDEIGE